MYPLVSIHSPALDANQATEDPLSVGDPGAPGRSAIGDGGACI
jgi:hypothetical protein